ncbi:ABC transporter permease [Nesterenkonia flava]|uniref:ABC transporter permease n=1 Tax=Nesterenkonia flava TaxID=469799 RepID=A0ABU1FS85_9MICC|nr:ABC transporter permease [Nesterenkonia flava]MDR5711519.1 ABC transporter permease [Nesterenkonia flava]
MNLSYYVLMDFWRNFRNFGNTFFIAFLPALLFLFFGVSMDVSGLSVGHGNVGAWIMIGMAAYGAVTATTSLAGSAAVEIQQGWGRQLSLTAMPHGMFVVAKSLVALAMAVLPVVVIYTIGAFTTVEMPLGRWLLAAVLSVVAALPFALYGLAVGLLFRSDAAVGAASGIVVVFAFFGNAFSLMDGILLEIGRFTPMYGPVALARWPLAEGLVLTQSGTPDSDPLWFVLVSIAVWSAIFALACLVLQRRRTARR